MKEGAKERKILDIVKENADDQRTEKQLQEELAGEMSAAQIGELIKMLDVPPAKQPEKRKKLFHAK